VKKDQKEYEFQKLSVAFYTDHYSLDSKERRNRLWMWFDRVTRYSLIPKIIVAMTPVTLALVLVGFLTKITERYGAYHADAVHLILMILLFCEGVFLIGLFLNIPYDYNYDVVANPAFKDLEENAWHEREIDQS